MLEGGELQRKALLGAWSWVVVVVEDCEQACSRVWDVLEFISSFRRCAVEDAVTGVDPGGE